MLPLLADFCHFIRSPGLWWDSLSCSTIAAALSLVGVGLGDLCPYDYRHRGLPGRATLVMPFWEPYPLI